MQIEEKYVVNNLDINVQTEKTSTSVINQKHSQTEVEELLEESKNINLKKNNLGTIFCFIKPYQIKEEFRN